MLGRWGRRSGSNRMGVVVTDFTNRKNGEWQVGDLAYVSEAGQTLALAAGSIVPITGKVAHDRVQGRWVMGLTCLGPAPMLVVQPGDKVPNGTRLRHLFGKRAGEEWGVSSVTAYTLTNTVYAVVSFPDPEPDPKQECIECDGRGIGGHGGRCRWCKGTGTIDPKQEQIKALRDTIEKAREQIRELEDV